MYTASLLICGGMQSYNIALHAGTRYRYSLSIIFCLYPLKFLSPLVQVENDVSQFSLCVFYDNGRKELCKDDDYPLKLRLKLGPSEDIAKLFVIETSEVEEILSAEVRSFTLSASYINSHSYSEKFICYQRL